MSDNNTTERERSQTDEAVIAILDAERQRLATARRVLAALLVDPAESPEELLADELDELGSS